MRHASLSQTVPQMKDQKTKKFRLFNEKGIVFEGRPNEALDFVLFRAEQEGIDLGTLTFAGQNLPQTTFRDLNLSGADFSGANLYKCCFEKCDLSDCLFVEANLPEASFQNADITGTDFTGANLAGADFTSAVMHLEAITDGAHMPSVKSFPQTITTDNQMDITVKTTKQQYPYVVDGVPVKFIYLRKNANQARTRNPFARWSGEPIAVVAMIANYKMLEIKLAVATCHFDRVFVLKDGSGKLQRDRDGQVARIPAEEAEERLNSGDTTVQVLPGDTFNKTRARQVAFGRLQMTALTIPLSQEMGMLDATEDAIKTILSIRTKGDARDFAIQLFDKRWGKGASDHLDVWPDVSDTDGYKTIQKRRDELEETTRWVFNTFGAKRLHRACLSYLSRDFTPRAKLAEIVQFYTERKAAWFKGAFIANDADRAITVLTDDYDTACIRLQADGAEGRDDDFGRITIRLQSLTAHITKKEEMPKALLIEGGIH